MKPANPVVAVALVEGVVEAEEASVDVEVTGEAEDLVDEVEAVEVIEVSRID